MALVHKAKKEEGKKHKTKMKTQKNQQIFKIKLRNDGFKIFGFHSKPISAVPEWFKADLVSFGRFGWFWLPADMIQFWPNWRELAQIDAELARIGAESARIQKKKKNSNVASTHRQPH